MFNIDIPSEYRYEKEKKMEKKMRIAFPTNDQVNVESHFGHCRQFAIINVENGEVKDKVYIDAPPHEPGRLPRFLGERNIDVIITGGMGQRAVDLFHAQNVDVILGAAGNIDANLNVFLKGDLYSKGSACSHNHDEEHSCNH